MDPAYDIRKAQENEAELLRSEGIDPAWPGFEELGKIEEPKPLQKLCGTCRMLHTPEQCPYR